MVTHFDSGAVLSYTTKSGNPTLGQSSFISEFSLDRAVGSLSVLQSRSLSVQQSRSLSVQAVLSYAAKFDV